MNLSVDGRRRILLRDGSPWFYLADTVWSAFTNPTDREWEEFLRLRREQGFAALQITGHLHEPRTIDGDEHLADLLDLALEQLRPV